MSRYEFSNNGPDIVKETVEEDDSYVINTPGTELPSTGGMGTTIFYLVGAVLVLGAGVVLVTRRRMAQ